MNIISGAFRQYKKSFGWLFGFTALLYAFYMINQLTNVGDGFWQQNYYVAGTYEVSCGRWLWPYIDKLTCGLHIEPLTTLGAIAIFAVSIIVAQLALDIEGKPVAIIGGIVALSSTIFSSVISYRFLAIVYSLACFFACAGAYGCIKARKDYLAVIYGGLGVALSMGLYQAYLGVFCVIGVVSLICLCLDENAGVRDIVTRIVRFILAVLVGGAVYFIVVKLHLALWNVAMTEYNGANEVSVGGIIRSLPSSLAEVTRTFGRYISGHLMKTVAFDDRINLTLIYHVVVGCLFVGLVIWKLIRIKANRAIRILVFVLGLVLMPIGANIATIIASGSGFMPQMGFAMAFLSGVLPAIIVERLVDIEGDKVKLGIGVLAAICVCMIYGQSAQVLIDHSAMKEGYTASVTLARGVLNDLQLYGLLDSDKKFFFIGKPSANETFYTTEVYDKANEYAQVGKFWLSDSNMYASYKALFNRVLGVDIEVLGDYYETKAFDEYYQTVPCYPNDGYILDWDTVIVKISEP